MALSELRKLVGSSGSHLLGRSTPQKDGHLQLETRHEHARTVIRSRKVVKLQMDLGCGVTPNELDSKL